MEFKHNIYFSSTFRKDVKKLQDKLKAKVEEAILEISKRPLIVGKRLKGKYKDKLSYRIGKIRIIYSIPKTCHVFIEKVRLRKSAYS